MSIPGGVPSWECTFQGYTFPGGVPSRGGGVSSKGWGIPSRALGVLSWGALSSGGVYQAYPISQKGPGTRHTYPLEGTWDRTHTTPTMDRHTPVKTFPSRNFVWTV